MTGDKQMQKGSGLNVKMDEIWVTEFNEEASLKFREKVIGISKEDPNEPIIIYIDSYGGMVDSLASMIETIDEVPNPIITVAMGKAMSCGAILLSHGDLRWIGTHSRVMIHEVSSGTGGDVHDMYADAVETKRLNKYFLGLLAKNCGIKGGYDGLRKLIKARDGRDIYLDAQAALKFGIVDAIGTPAIRSYTAFDISTTPPKQNLLKKSLPNK